MTVWFQVSFGGGAGVTGTNMWGGNSSPGVSGGGVVNYQQHPGSPGAYYNGIAASTGEDMSAKPGMLEVVAGLSRDCFIIPLACVDRFLPAGLTVSFFTYVLLSNVYV